MAPLCRVQADPGDGRAAQGCSSAAGSGGSADRAQGCQLVAEAERALGAMWVQPVPPGDLAGQTRAVGWAIRVLCPPIRMGASGWRPVMAPRPRGDLTGRPAWGGSATP